MKKGSRAALPDSRTGRQPRRRREAKGTLDGAQERTSGAGSRPADAGEGGEVSAERGAARNGGGVRGRSEGTASWPLVRASVVLARGSAPEVMKSLTTSTWPSRQAHCGRGGARSQLQEELFSANRAVAESQNAREGASTAHSTWTSRLLPCLSAAHRALRIRHGQLRKRQG